MEVRRRVAIYAASDGSWLHGPSVAGSTKLSETHEQYEGEMAPAIIAQFVPDQDLPEGLLRIASTGLRAGHPYNEPSTFDSLDLVWHVHVGLDGNRPAFEDGYNYCGPGTLHRHPRFGWS